MSPGLEKSRRENLRWLILLALNSAQPVGASEQVMFCAITPMTPDLTQYAVLKEKLTPTRSVEGAYDVIFPAPNDNVSFEDSAKGIEELIKATDELRNAGLEIVIAGVNETVAHIVLEHPERADCQ